MAAENTHVFIVRIWLEPREIQGAPPEWRGVIEHVPDGERRYAKDLEEVLTFISSYFARMDVRVSWRGRVIQWLRRIALLKK